MGIHLYADLLCLVGRLHCPLSEMTCHLGIAHVIPESLVPVRRKVVHEALLVKQCKASRLDITAWCDIPKCLAGQKPHSCTSQASQKDWPASTHGNPATVAMAKKASRTRK